MIKPILLALTLFICIPFMAQAAEITLLPSVRLQIGDQDYRGNYWDGGKWLNSNDWRNHYRWQNSRWQRYDRDWERGREKRDDSYMRGYRDGFQDRQYGHRRGHGHRH